MLTKENIATARSVVTNPELYLRRPALLRDGWLALKEAQGAPISLERQARIAPVAVLNPPAVQARVEAIAGEAASGFRHVLQCVNPVLRKRLAVARLRKSASDGGDAA